ncbi:hypothetical protein SH668x_000841 [Planctomicrobium sp. SH668]
MMQVGELLPDGQLEVRVLGRLKVLPALVEAPEYPAQEDSKFLTEVMEF